MANRSAKDLRPGQMTWVERGIFARRTKSGELRYGISYRFQGRRIQEVVGSSKTLARKALGIRKAEIAQDRFNIPSRKSIPTFDKFRSVYLDHARQKKRTWRDDERTLERMNSFFGRKRLDQITSWDVERYRAMRAENRTKATANRDLALLRHMFNLAVEWGAIENSPARGVKAYKEDEKPMRVLTESEESKLIDAAAEHLRPIIVAALNTGMRRGELLGLKWEHVELRQRVITVEYSKSGRIRHIPINDRLFRVLRSLTSSRSGYVFEYNGVPVEDVKTAFGSALKRAGIRRCRFHDLRHTFATRLVLAGVDLPTVKELMGHANIATTMRYAHPSPEHRRNAVDLL